MKLDILGVRHHGVGSAINVLKRIQDIKPDYIIVEGPIEMMDSLKDVDLTKFKPPVSIMAYNPKNLQQSLFYPFSEFSPEWQIFKYAKDNNIEFITADLPLKHSFMLEETEDRAKDIKDLAKTIHDNPLEEIAKLEGYHDSNSWWDSKFEEQYYSNAKEHFETILEVMSALRQRYINSDFETNERREAFMRESIRKAKRAKKEQVVFVCGAWHAPALLEFETKRKDDKELISKLPKCTIETSWIPWTNNRLSWRSGYGAGIESAGWYTHLWKNQNDDGKKWLIKATQIFRKNDIDISTAHVIEAFHLASVLTLMRGKNRAGLQELNEAIVSVMCMGDDILLNYITEKLSIGSTIGKIPNNLPRLPIQKDFDTKIKKYRFQIRDDTKEYKLDLRTPRGLEKSIFLHRLKVLGIKWGQLAGSRSKGNFKEIWNLSWKPEVELDIIDKAIWGNSIEIATQNYVNDLAKNSQKIDDLIFLMENSILAELFNSIDFLIKRVDEISSQSYDTAILIKTIIPLISVYRYSDIRQTDQSVLGELIENLLVRVVSSLESSCYGLNQEMATEMFELISKLNENIFLIENDSLIDQWYEEIIALSKNSEISFLIKGASYRILLDTKKYNISTVERGLSKALSIGEEPIKSAQWIEGFLKGSAMILIVDDTIWNILYVWMQNIDDESFNDLLPLLRRTFSHYSPSDRKKIGAKAKRGVSINNPTKKDENSNKNFDENMAIEMMLRTKEILQGGNS